MANRKVLIWGLHGGEILELAHQTRFPCADCEKSLDATNGGCQAWCPKPGHLGRQIWITYTDHNSYHCKLWEMRQVLTNMPFQVVVTAHTSLNTKGSDCIQVVPPEEHSEGLHHPAERRAGRLPQDVTWWWLCSPLLPRSLPPSLPPFYC